MVDFLSLILVLIYCGRCVDVWECCAFGKQTLCTPQREEESSLLSLFFTTHWIHITIFSWRVIFSSNSFEWNPLQPTANLFVLILPKPPVLDRNLQKKNMFNVNIWISNFFSSLLFIVSNPGVHRYMWLSLFDTTASIILTLYQWKWLFYFFLIMYLIDWLQRCWIFVQKRDRVSNLFTR